MINRILSCVLAAAFSAGVLSPARAAEDTKLTTLARVKAVPKGGLKNPLSETPEIIEAGKALFQGKTCSACHGATGSGIHCPSLINDAWIYGSDDDTLFRLVALGSEHMAGEGYTRGDKEKHAGPMPAFGEAIADEQDLWRIITYIRSLPPK